MAESTGLSRRIDSALMPSMSRPNAGRAVWDAKRYRSLLEAWMGIMRTKASLQQRPSSPRKPFVKGIGKPIVLVDGAALASLMLEYGVGVSPDRT
jgi:hypothetical protein